MKFTFKKGDRVVCQDKVRLSERGVLRELFIPGVIQSLGGGRNEQYYVIFDWDHRYSINWRGEYYTPSGGWFGLACLTAEVPAEMKKH